MSVSSFDLTMMSGLGRSLGPRYRFDASIRTTPGTGNSSRSLRSYTIIAVFEGGGNEKGTIGMAVMDLRYPEVTIYEFMDSSSYLRLTTRVQVEDPIEIIVADSIGDKKNTVLLVEALKSTSDEATITTVNKRYFCEEQAVELIKNLANPEISDCDFVPETKHLATAACGGLLKYVEYIQTFGFNGRSLKICYRDIEKSCMIDKNSWKCLELIDSAEMCITKNGRTSLLSAIDYTLTPSGYRLLRSNLLQPLADSKLIEVRYDAVEELCENPHLLEQLRKVLSKVSEIDGVLALCAKTTVETNVTKCEANITQLQQLRKSLEFVEPLKKCIMDTKSPLLKIMQRRLGDARVGQVIKILDGALDTSTLGATKKNSLILKNQKCYAIRQGLCLNLDIARKTYEELLNDIQDGSLALELDEQLRGENTRMAYSIARGFHYVWSHPEAATVELPPIFVNAIRNRNSLTFSSKQLIRYNDRVNQCLSEVMVSSNVIICEMIEKIREHIPVLYNIMDSMAYLDFISSLARYSSRVCSSRPTLGNALMFKDGRHPLLDMHQEDKCVPNDTYLCPEAHFGLITGPNMAGKSTYLRQVCQLSILAQMGCFIPADIATIPVFQHIFSRVGHNDNLSLGLSAFSMEMSEMAAIMHYANGRTLIVIDELARSTSTEEGIAISWAISEFLLKRNSFVYLATHFLDLATLEQKYTAVENYHFNSQSRLDENGDEMFSSSHKLYKGSYRGPLYGFELAQLATFPPDVIEEARRIARQVNSEADRGEDDVAAAKSKLLVRTALKLRQALVLCETASRETMIEYLESVQKFYAKKILALETGRCVRDDGEQEQEMEEHEEEDVEQPVGEAVSEDNY